MFYLTPSGNVVGRPPLGLSPLQFPLAAYGGDRLIRVGVLNHAEEIKGGN